MAHDCSACGVRLFSDDVYEHRRYVEHLEATIRSYRLQWLTGAAIEGLLVIYSVLIVFTRKGAPGVAVIAAMVILGAWTWKRREGCIDMRRFLHENRR